MKTTKEQRHKIFIRQIFLGEQRAKETLKISIEHDIFDVKLKKINQSHQVELSINLYANTINSYHELRNYYKASNEEFFFRNSHCENKKSNEERLDFIAMILNAQLDKESNTKKEIEEMLDTIYQLKNIENIVFETHLLELKSNVYKKTLAEIEKTVGEDESKKSNKVKLSELITHSQSEKIVEDIKIKYKNIRGKRLKLLLMAFQKEELIPNTGNNKKFHDCCNNEFSWNIASYNAMNGYKYNESKEEKQDLESMIEFLKKYNSNK